MIFVIGFILLVVAFILAEKFPLCHHILGAGIALAGVTGFMMMVLSIAIVVWKYLP